MTNAKPDTVDTENGPCLYDLTGNICDINTLLVNRAQLRRMLPWWRKLAIYRNNWRRFHRWRLNM